MPLRLLSDTGSPSSLRLLEDQKLPLLDNSKENLPLLKDEATPSPQQSFVGPIPEKRKRDPIVNVLEGIFGNNTVDKMNNEAVALDYVKKYPEEEKNLSDVNTPEMKGLVDRARMSQGSPQSVSVGETVATPLAASGLGMMGMNPLSIAGALGAITAKHALIDPTINQIPEGTGKSAADVANLITDLPFAKFGANPAEALAAHRASKAGDVLSEIAKDLNDIKSKVKEANPDLPDEVINKITPESVVQGAKSNPSIADYINRIQARVSPFSKIGLSTEDVSIPEDIKPPDENAPTFFSKLEQVAKDKIPNNASPQQILATLGAAGVKQDEIDWTDLNSFLDGKDKVSKEDLLNHIKNNQVEIKDVEKNDAAMEGDSDKTKFQSYQLHGGNNYRELLLTLPEKVSSELPPGLYPFHSRDGWALTNREGAIITAASPTKEEAIKKFNKSISKEHPFQSGHFEEGNVLSHVRMNDRTGPNGEKILHLEEVQSDWHQKGRKQGYNAPDSYIDKEFQQGVPDAPFKKNWHELVMKRMLRHAAENGYDKLSWTTGEQQAERYDLSKQISSIEAIKRSNGEYILRMLDNSGQRVNANEQTANVASEKLEDFVGKDLAEKISKQKEESHTYSGIDLKVGGEGMKGFYDQILPSFMNKYAKKWGARVGETNVDISSNNTEENSIGRDPRLSKVHSIDITPSMKKSVLKEGQPMFDKQGEMFSPGEPQIGKEIPKEQHGKSENEGRKILDKYSDLKDVLVNVEYLKTADGKDALGLYYKLKISIPKGAEIRTYIHEMGHAIFDMFLTRTEKRALLDQTIKYRSISRVKEKGHTDAQHQSKIDNIAEEYLIRDFTKYAGEGTDANDKNGFFNKVKGLFERLLYRIKKFFKSYQVKDFYEDILSGKFKGAKIDESAGEIIPKYEEWSDNQEPSKPIEKSSEPINIEDKAEMELEIMASGNVHPLETAMKQIGGVKFGDFESQPPKRFRGKKPSDEAMQELSNNHGIEFNSEGDFKAALDKLGDSQQRFGLSTDVQTYLKNKDNVNKLEKKLSQTLKPGLVKRIIHSYVGVKKPKTDILIQTTEQQVLKHMLKVREKASKIGFEAGKREGKEEVRSKAREREVIRKQKIESAKRFTPEQRKALYQRAYSKGLIVKLDNGKIRDKFQGVLRYYNQASFGGIMEYLDGLRGEQGNPPLLFKMTGDIKEDGDVQKMIDEANADWKDINRLEIGTLDLPRIIEKVSGIELFDNNILADNTYGVLMGADDARTEKMNEMLKDLSDNIKGFHEDTKASAELMKKIESGDPSVEKEAKYFKEKYDYLIKKANEIRESVGKKPIKYRKDYFTHIKDWNLLTSFFKGDIKKIDDLTNEQWQAIAKGEYAKVSVPFNKFAMERKGERTKFDAIGNYKKYLETLLYEIYMSPAIKHTRKFTDYALLRQPHAKKAVDDLLGELTGKPSSMDHIFIRPIVSNKVIKALNNRFGANALIGNISYYLTNASNIATASGELGRYTIKGMHGFLGSKELRRLAFEKSSLLKSRRGLFDAEIKKMDAFIGGDWQKVSVWESIKQKDKQLEYLISSINRVIEYNNVGSSWVGAYLKAIDKFKFSPEKAYAYADGIARKTQGGYRPYEMPAYMRSDVGKLISKFGTWAFNMMNYFLYDLGGANIPKNLISPITKTSGGKIRFGTFIVLVATLMFVNRLYKKMGLYEPYQASSFVPQTPLTRGRYQQPPAGKMASDVINIATGGSGKKEKTKNKARAKAIVDIGTMLGPRYGGAQIKRFLSGEVLPHPKEKKHLRLL